MGSKIGSLRLTRMTLGWMSIAEAVVFMPVVLKAAEVMLPVAVTLTPPMVVMLVDDTSAAVRFDKAVALTAADDAFMPMDVTFAAMLVIAAGGTGTRNTCVRMLLEALRTNDELTLDVLAVDKTREAIRWAVDELNTGLYEVSHGPTQDGPTHGHIDVARSATHVRHRLPLVMMAFMFLVLSLAVIKFAPL